MENLGRFFGTYEVCPVEKNDLTDTVGVGTIYRFNNFVLLQLQVSIMNETPMLPNFIPLKYAPKSNVHIRALLVRTQDSRGFSSHTGYIDSNGNIVFSGNSTSGMHELVTVYMI